MCYEIRRAVACDAAAVSAVVSAAYSGYIKRIGRPPAPMASDYPALIASGSVSVLDHRGRVTGVLVLVPARDHLLVENIAVAPAEQRRGWGRRLMQFAEERAWSWGFGEIRLYTNELMAGNQRFYPALGYEETGRFQQDGFRRVFYRKLLGARPAPCPADGLPGGL